MHKFLLITFIACFTHSFSQRWVDSMELARSYYKKKEYGRAISIYERNPNKKKEQKPLDAEIAQSYYRNRDFEKSKRYYGQALRKAKTTKIKSKIHHNIGNSKFKKKDYNGAIDSYKKALRLNPNDEETRYNLSEAIRRKNQNKPKNNPPKSPPKNKDNNPKKNNKNQSSDNKPNNSPKNLPNKKAEKMLDELSKQESRTKRKMQGNSNSKSSNKSSKDW